MKIKGLVTIMKQNYDLNDEELSLIQLAKSTDDYKLLKELMKSSYMNVRRAILKNVNITKDIVMYLSCDPTKNISYQAKIHELYESYREPTIKYHKTDNNRCVTCTVDEEMLSQYCRYC